MVSTSWQDVQYQGSISGGSTGAPMSSVLLAMAVMTVCVLGAVLMYRAWRDEQRTWRDQARAIADEAERWLQSLP
jgi:hypothetical protein